MAKPQPWSYSALTTFKSCPRKFHEESVVKSVPKREPSAAQIYGIRVHKAFEDYQASDGKIPLPTDLRVHQPFMDKLMSRRIAPAKVERRVALDTKLNPCEFFGKDVFWRGVIDYDGEMDNGHFNLVDYKTGKKKNEHLQLKMFAVFKLREGAKRVVTEFYWTQTQEITPLVLEAFHIKAIMNEVKPDLAQYVEAFRSDVWQPRQNGLCKNYCDVKDCEFHGMGR